MAIANAALKIKGTAIVSVVITTLKKINPIKKSPAITAHVIIFISPFLAFTF